MDSESLPAPLPRQSLEYYHRHIVEVATATVKEAKRCLKSESKASAREAIKDGVRTLGNIIILIEDCHTAGIRTDIGASMSRVAALPIFAGYSGQTTTRKRLANYRKWNKRLTTHHGSAETACQPHSGVKAKPSVFAQMFRKKIEVEHLAWNMIVRLRRISAKLH